jgi:uncharacterized peroxidase-related enzyme
MTHIRTIEPEQAESTLKFIYDEFTKLYGAVPLFLRAMSLRPDVAAALLPIYQHLLLEEHRLDRTTKELLIVYTSRLNSCSYCSTAHSAIITATGSFTPDQLQSIMDDVQGSTLIGAPTKLLLEYAKKVTESAYKMWEADVQRLRDGGFSDEAILEATLIVCLYNMMNRFVSALGVPVDDFQSIFKQAKEAGSSL